MGTPCDPDAEAASCAGVCVEVEGVGFCSHRCRLGSADDCGQEQSGLCFFPEEDEGSIGDVGFCSLSCDADGDCEHAEMHCEPFGAASLEALTGKRGVCAPGTSDAPDENDAPDGGDVPDPAAVDAGPSGVSTPSDAGSGSERMADAGRASSLDESAPSVDIRDAADGVADGGAATNAGPSAKR